MSKALNNKVKLNDAVSVDDFGAVANSEAAAVANLVAFQNALTAASTSTKYVVCGTGKTYWLPTQSPIGMAGVIFDGRGATLKQASGAHTTNWLLITACNGFKMLNFNIDGNRTGAASLGVDSSLLLIYNTEDVDLSCITIFASAAKGVAVVSGVSGSGTRRIRLSEITAYNCSKQAVMTDRSNGGTDAPACEDIILDKILVKSTDHAGVAINDGSRRVTLTNSILDVNNATWDALAIRGSREITVSNVIGRRGRNGCQISVLDAAALARGEDSRNITLSNNIWEFNNQSGLQIVGAINVTVNGDIARNNGQTTTATGFNISQVTGVRRSSYITLGSVSAIDDQAVPTQHTAIQVAASDVVKISSPVMFGNTTRNRVYFLTGVTGFSVANDSDDGATQKRVSVTTGSIAAGGNAVVTASFATAFDVAPNWATAQVLFASASPFLRVQQITGLGTTSVQVLVRNDGASAATGTLYAEASYMN